MKDSLKTSKFMMTIPEDWYIEITEAVEPFVMKNVQDYTREALEVKLKSEGRIK